jgi:hypothetical protein
MGQRSKDRDQKVKNYPLSGFSSPFRAAPKGAWPRKTNLRGFTVSAPQSLTAARGRDDTIHPEVFDQLTVMIECVGSGERRQE